MNKHTQLVIAIALVAFSGLVSNKAQAAYPVTCKNGTTVYVPQMGDPICSKFTCVPVGRDDRFQDFADPRNMTVSQIWQFEIPEGMGTPQHPAGSAPNILGGWTVVGERRNRKYVNNARACVHTVSAMLKMAETGRNLRGGLRHDIPNAVVVIPSEPNPCLDNLAECSAAYTRTNQVAAAVRACTASRLFDPATSTCVARPTPTSGAASSAPVRGSGATVVKVSTAAKDCESKGKFFYQSKCLTRAQMAAVVGAGGLSPLGMWGWILAALLLAVVLVLLYLLVWRRLEPAGMERFEAEARPGSEVDSLWEERDRLRSILKAIMEKVKGFVPFTLTAETVVTTVEALLRELARLRTHAAEFVIVKAECDAAQADARAKQAALDAADARNAALTEQLRGTPATAIPTLDIVLLSAQATALLHRLNVEPESNGERTTDELAAAVLNQLMAEVAKVLDERDQLKRDLADARRNMQAAADGGLGDPSGRTPRITADLFSLQQSHPAGAAVATGADREDAQDARLADIECKLDRVRAAFGREFGIIGEALAHPRSTAKVAAGLAAHRRLQTVVSELASPAN